MVARTKTFLQNPKLPVVYTIVRYGCFAYVHRPPTKTEHLRYIRNGYVTPDLVREPDASVYDYIRGNKPPHYPVPAIWKEPHCLFCGSEDDLCRMHPQDCLEGRLVAYNAQGNPWNK